MALFVTPKVFVDLNNSGIFGSTEDVSTYISMMQWNRGAEPEQETTPSGSMTLNVIDPNGDWVPGSTASAFGSGVLDIGLPVKAQVVFDGTTYNAFRGKIERISASLDSEGAQRATIFCLDETEELGRTSITYPNSIASTGNVGHTTGQPLQFFTAGTSTGIIAKILDASSFSSTRRSLSEPGASTFDNWWAYNKFSKKALDEVEEHERGRIFIDGIGDVVFHSSTHNNGSTALATFNANLDQLRFSLSNRDVINKSLVTVHGRDDITLANTGVIGAAASTSFPTIGNGSVFTFIVEFDEPPYKTATVPLAEANSTKGLSLKDVGGPTTFTGTQVTISGTFLGASAMRVAITNNSGVTIEVRRPENATDTNQVCPIVGNGLTDFKMTSTAQNLASQTNYGIRTAQEDYEFFARQGKASSRASELVDENSTAHARGITLHLQGSDSDIITQILTRELDDRISVNSTAMKFTNKNFYITAVDWLLDKGGYIEATYTLDDAT